MAVMISSEIPLTGKETPCLSNNGMTLDVCDVRIVAEEWIGTSNNKRVEVLLFQWFANAESNTRETRNGRGRHTHSLTLRGLPLRARGNRYSDSGLSDDAQKSHQKASEESGIDNCAGQKTIGI